MPVVIILFTTYHIWIAKVDLVIIWITNSDWQARGHKQTEYAGPACQKALNVAVTWGWRSHYWIADLGNNSDQTTVNQQQEIEQAGDQMDRYFIDETVLGLWRWFGCGDWPSGVRHRGRADYCRASATKRCPTDLSARRCRFHSSSRKAGSNHNANLDLIDTPQRNRQLADIKRTEPEGKQYIGHQLQTVKRRSA